MSPSSELLKKSSAFYWLAWYNNRNAFLLALKSVSFNKNFSIISSKSQMRSSPKFKYISYKQTIAFLLTYTCLWLTFSTIALYKGSNMPRNCILESNFSVLPLIYSLGCSKSFLNPLQTKIISSFNVPLGWVFSITSQ